MRTFKCDGRRFHGFDKDFSTPHRLVLVRDEDVFDVWAIDEGTASDNITADSMDNLLRYFTFTDSLAQVVGTYREQGFLGFIAAEQFVAPESRFK